MLFSGVPELFATVAFAKFTGSPQLAAINKYFIRVFTLLDRSGRPGTTHHMTV